MATEYGKCTQHEVCWISYQPRPRPTCSHQAGMRHATATLLLHQELNMGHLCSWTCVLVSALNCLCQHRAQLLLSQRAEGTPKRAHRSVLTRATAAAVDGLDAVARRGFFATHRGLLELPQVWETVLQWIDLPSSEPSATPKEASAAIFPQSHTVSPPVTASLGDGGAHAARSRARLRHSAQLRPEAEARSKGRRDAWSRCAAALRRSGRSVVSTAAEEFGGDWVVVEGARTSTVTPPDAPTIKPLRACPGHQAGV
jgi:hypothetical protein